MLACRWQCAFLLVLLGLAMPAQGMPARRASLGTPLPAPAARAWMTPSDSTFTCFESATLVPAINPGCFVTFDPPQPGDCTSGSAHYLLQVLRPSLALPRRLRGFSFRNNDGETVFPAAGALLVPAGATITLPGPAALESLQAGPVPGGADTSWVFVDLRSARLVVPAGADTALLLVLRFPAAGRLVAVGSGPGVSVDADLPDQDCDFFTPDGGVTWYAPAYDPDDPLSVPLDWGFVLHWEPVTALVARTWGDVKGIYRTP